ncbi:MAG: GNAT family N-acetyltransferase [Oligoflexia bacterium]|nr:GNAT family N-acetyltransferase [Oligoflexia bacterium]
MIVPLFLNIEKDNNDFQTSVYKHILKQISSKFEFENGINFVFTDNKTLLAKIRKGGCIVVVSTSDLPIETALILKGFGIIQIIIGHSKDLLGVVDIMIDPLGPEQEPYWSGPKYLLPSVITNFPIEKISHLLSISTSVLENKLSYKNALDLWLNTINLCQLLEWDSNFFGINVAYISCIRLTANIEKQIKRFVAKYRIDLLEYLCNCHDRESVETSEKNGYSFVDIRLTFEQYLHSSVAQVNFPEGFQIKHGTTKDKSRLMNMAEDLYQYSRYFYDRNFNNIKVKEFYPNWIGKAIDGTFDDFAYVLYHEQLPVGFCTIKKDQTQSAKIGLFGIDPQFTGKGLASKLLLQSLYLLYNEEGVNHIEVVTQGRNYSAQRLYQRCGFVTKSTALWYHKWFH